jgi:uncharacterized membrane protein HdeD (DUF308 family)
MKFLISKDLEYSRLLNTLMVGVNMGLVFYLMLDILLHGYLLGIDLNQIAQTLYGNPEEFIEPILLDTLLLHVHIDLFMSLFTVMIIASIYIRLFDRETRTRWLVHLVFLLNLVAPVLLLVAYFTSVASVYLWGVSFLMGHIFTMSLAIRIVKKLMFK